MRFGVVISVFYGRLSGFGEVGRNRFRSQYVGGKIAEGSFSYFD